MSTHQRPRRNDNGARPNAQDNERSPLLPSHAGRRKFSSTSSPSFFSFIKSHAFSPLPAFDSAESLPIAYLPPLLLQCLITGLADASTYTLTKIWVGFQTGNLVQIIINTFDFLLPSDSNTDGSTDAVRDKLQESLSSLLGFAIGCQITSNIIHRLSTDRTKRLTIVLMSVYRCATTLLIILLGMRYPAVRLSGSLDWVVIMVLASNLGCQATYSTSLATPFSNTVVFTQTLTSVTSDVHLPMLHLNGSNRYKLLSMFGLLGGAAVSQVILKVATRLTKSDRHIAVQRCLIVLSGMELLLGLMWLLCGIVSNWRQHQRRSSEVLPDEADGEDHDR